MNACADAPPSVDRLDDYLGLLALPLPRLSVFHGASGSGKSSQIRLLCARHPALRGRAVVVAAPAALPAAPVDVLAIEELQTLRDARCLGAALRRAGTVLVASHVDPMLLWPWRLRTPHRCHRLDRCGDKLARELDHRGVHWTPAALQAFCARYGANYTDLAIVLERGGNTDLDRALALFSRGSGIAHGARQRHSASA